MVELPHKKHKHARAILAQAVVIGGQGGNNPGGGVVTAVVATMVFCALGGAKINSRGRLGQSQDLVRETAKTRCEQKGCRDCGSLKRIAATAAIGSSGGRNCGHWV